MARCIAPLIAQLLFTPLLAAWSIWACIGISTRASDVRVAQQLGTLAGLPLLAFTSLITFQLITPTVSIAIGLALALLILDIAGWRIVTRTPGKGSARPKPSPLSNRSSAAPNEAKTTIITAAAAVITRPVRTSPARTAAVLSPRCCHSSWMRETRNRERGQWVTHHPNALRRYGLLGRRGAVAKELGRHIINRKFYQPIGG